MTAAAVVVRATWPQDATGTLLVAVCPLGDTQPAQAVVLTAPGGESPAQITAPLATLAVEAVSVMARNDATRAASDVQVWLQVRCAQ